jgi:hypothetical protein
MTPDEWAAHRGIYGLRPEPIDGSPVNAAWEQHFVAGYGWPSKEPTRDTVDPELMTRLMAFRKSFDSDT